jgi:hypothetical protein
LQHLPLMAAAEEKGDTGQLRTLTRLQLSSCLSHSLWRSKVGEYASVWLDLPLHLPCIASAEEKCGFGRQLACVRIGSSAWTARACPHQCPTTAPAPRNK